MDNIPSYANYLMPQSAASVIPQQLGNDYLSILEQQLNLQETQQMNQLLGSANQRGTVSSGDTNVGLAGITGNAQNQFANAFTGLSNQSTGQAQGQQFQKQFEQQGFQNQLAYMAQQAADQQNLAALRAQLTPQGYQPSFGALLGQGLSQALPGAIFGFAGGAGQGALQRFGAGSSPMGMGQPLPGLGQNAQYNYAPIQFDPTQFQSPWGMPGQLNPWG